MVRPRKRRCIRAMPVSTFYKPQGIALHELKGVTLTLEGFEAIRLVDGESVNREKAAEMLNVSSSTLCRILAEARGTVAKALANGWALRIEGGDYRVVDGGGRQGKGSSGCLRGKRKRGTAEQG